MVSTREPFREGEEEEMGMDLDGWIQISCLLDVFSSWQIHKDISSFQHHVGMSTVKAALLSTLIMEIHFKKWD